MIVALMGMPQSGKTELRPVFEECGYRFVDLYEVGARIRREDRHGWYAEHFPGEIQEDGKVRPEYYHRLARQPGLIDEVLAVESGPILDEAWRVMQHAMRKREHTVLSWVYWFRNMLHRVTEFADAFLVLECRDRAVWQERLHGKLRERGMVDPLPSVDDISVLLSAGLYRPENFRNAIQSVLPWRKKVIDTSPSDWGADELRDHLLKWPSLSPFRKNKLDFRTSLER